MDIKVNKIQDTNNTETGQMNASTPSKKPQNDSIFTNSPSISVNMNYSEKKDSVDIFSQESFSKKINTDFGIFNNTINIKNQESQNMNSGTLTLSDTLRFSSNINEQINQENTLSASITSKGNIEEHQNLIKKLETNENVYLPDMNNTLRLSDTQKIGFKLDKNNEIYTKLTASGMYSDRMTMHTLGYENGINNNLTIEINENLPPFYMRNNASINLSYSNVMMQKREPAENYTTTFGLSSTLSFKPLSNLDVSLSSNGKYGIKNDNSTNISYGAGLNMTLKPIEDNKDFKVSFGMMYSNSEGQSQTAQMSTQSMGAKNSLTLSTGIDFNKKFNLNGKYQIDLENKNNGTLSFGSIIKL